MNLTTKQFQILAVILKGNPDGSFVDMDQLLENLPYETTKESMQFSIRALINKNMIEKRGQESRRSKKRVVFAPTELSYKLLRGADVFGAEEFL